MVGLGWGGVMCGDSDRVYESMPVPNLSMVGKILKIWFAALFFKVQCSSAQYLMPWISPPSIVLVAHT